MMNWKRSTALLTSSLILSIAVYRIVLACGGGVDGYDYYPQFFTPTVNQSPAFFPFHYTGWQKYYDDYLSPSGDSSAIPDANLREWSAYTGGGISTADLDSFVYRYPYASLSSLYYNLEKAKPLRLSSQKARNGMTRWFQQSKDLEALGYLMYAKRCEPEVTTASDWEASSGDTAKRGGLLRNGLQLYKAAKNESIRERYAFQVLRLAFLNAAYEQTLTLYTSLVGDAKKTGTEIFYRSLGYKAGALFRLGRKDDAAYLYSLVFDGSDGQKKSSYVSFDWATTRDKSKVLARCKSPHEKAVVYLMDGLNEYDMALPQLQAAYAADPSVRGLNILLTREINKLEERYQQEELLAARNLSSTWYFNRYSGESPYQSEAAESRKSNWKEYAPKLLAFANRVAAEGKAAQPGIWKLGAAYIYMVREDFDKAATALAAAGSGKLTGEERAQLEVLETVLLVRKAGKLDAKTEAALLPQLQRIEKRSETDNAYAKIYRDILSTVVAAAYLQHHDTVKAIFTLARVEKGEQGFSVASDFQDLPGVLLERISNSKFQSLKAYVEDRKKSPWDAWLTFHTAYTPGILREFEGTKYIRSYEWPKAIAVLQQLADSDLRYHMFLSPFVAQIPDAMEPDSNVRIASYTKLQFAKEMQELKGRNDAASLFRYGTGLYNMSYYGWSHEAFTYYRSSVDDLGYYDDPLRKNLPLEFQEYYGVMSAENCFRQAAAGTGDKELKARALFMAAKCWQKRCPGTPVSSWDRSGDSTYYQNALKNPYFARLKAEGSGSAFYEEASTRCSYLMDYLSRKQ